jgi:hypothetical protein
LLTVAFASMALSPPPTRAMALAPPHVGCPGCPEFVFVTDVRIERYGTVDNGYPRIRIWITCDESGVADVDVIIKQLYQGGYRSNSLNPNGPWFRCSTTPALLEPWWDSCECAAGNAYRRGWAEVQVRDGNAFRSPYAGTWEGRVLLR